MRQATRDSPGAVTAMAAALPSIQDSGYMSAASNAPQNLPQAARLALSAHSAECTLVTDCNDRILYLSAGLAEKWGIDQADTLGRHYATLADFPDTFNNAMHRVRNTALETQVSAWIDAGNAKESCRFIIWHLAPWFIQAGHVGGVVVRIEDQTELATVKKELEHNRQRLIDFTNATSDWLWEMDSNLRFTWISHQMEQFYDMPREELYGRHRMASPATPAEEKAWIEHCAALQKRQPFRDFVYRARTHSGIRSARISGVPVFDDDGNFCGYRGTASDDTDVERVKSLARQTESRFVHAIDEFPGAFALYDENAALIVYNRRYAQIYSFLGEQLKPGLRYRDYLQAQVDASLFVHEDGMPIDDAHIWIEQQLERLHRSTNSAELRCADGRWMRLTMQQLPDGGYLETLVDITKLKRSEITVKEERNLLRSLINNIPDFIYAKDTEGRFIVKNESVTKYMKSVRLASLGLSDEPGENATDFDYYNAREAQMFLEEEKMVIECGKALLNQEELRSTCDKQEAIWITTSKVPLKDTEGNTIGLVGTGRNITNQKRAEARLLESNTRFRDFAETAAELFWETDAELKITYVSERYQELTGYPPEAILGQPYQQVICTRIDDPLDFERVSKCLDTCRAFTDLEIRIEQQNKAVRHIVLSGKPCFNSDNVFIGYRGAGRDITKARNLENMLQHQASHDDLTKLPNRREFVRRLESVLQYAHSNKRQAVLGYLDLDQFKVVNDSVGHLAGDELLIQVTNLIESQLRKTDTIARLGGDEFGVLIENASIEEAVTTIERIITQFEAFRFQWNNQLFGIGVSAGLVEINDASIDATELMSRADVACFAAKDAGRGRVHVYNPQVSDLSMQHKQLLMAAGIRDSIASNRFQLYAQPIASIKHDDPTTRSIEHYEILLRLSGEDDTLILPGTFIPAAERYGLMGDIDRWVITQTLEMMHRCSDQDNRVTVTINLSGHSLTDSTLSSFIIGRMQHYEINPGRVCFEITETAAIRNLALARQFIADMKKEGCTFALDDFGSGLSSFGYLKHFDIDYLKIDGSFVRDIARDPTDRIMVTSIDQIGKSLGITTIAEFVEDEAAIAELCNIGVDLLQGYAIGKPVPFKEVFSNAA